MRPASIGEARPSSARNSAATAMRSRRWTIRRSSHRSLPACRAKPRPRSALGGGHCQPRPRHSRSPRPLAAEEGLDLDRIGIAGHSFGGWTALAAPDAEPRIAAVVALAPAGASQPRPGILPVRLDFRWGRDVPTLLLVAENDTSIPLRGMVEIFDRVPAAKRMVILRRADHLHFLDDVERTHETVRAMALPPELEEMQRGCCRRRSSFQARRPIGSLARWRSRISTPS